MIAAWMLYTVAVTFLLLAGASATDYAARALRVPTRGLWAVAMIVAIVLSVRALVAGLEIETVSSATVNTGVSTLSGDLRESAGRPATIARERNFRTRLVTTARTVATVLGRIEQAALRINAGPLDRWNGVLVSLWVAASCSALLWLAGALVRLRRRGRGLVSATVRDQRVLVSRDLGPALLGVLRPRIVLPEWVLSLPANERDAILAHEREHVVAHDPALLALAVFVIVLQPWNVALWALLARLHIAIEVDCDRRVLDLLPKRDSRWYGRLLISVYERTTPGLSLTIGLVARPSNLDLRIRRIAHRPRALAGGAAAFAGVALVLTACAAASPVRRVVEPPLVASAGVSAPARVDAPETRCSLAGRRTVLWPGQWPISAGCSIYGDIVVLYIDSTNLLVSARDTADSGVTMFYVFETTPGTTTADLVWSTTAGRALLSDSAMIFTSPDASIKPLVLRLWPAPARTRRPDAVELRIDNMMMAELRGIPWAAVAQLPAAPRCTAAESESQTMPSVIQRRAGQAADELTRACFVTGGQRFDFPIISAGATQR